MSQNAWCYQHAVKFTDWTLIRTHHTGLKNFPELILFDRDGDLHITRDLIDEKLEIVAKLIQMLGKWYEEMMKISTSTIDLIWTVIREGELYHTRNYLNSYLRRLERSEREEMVKVILDRHENYLS